MIKFNKSLQRKDSVPAHPHLLLGRTSKCETGSAVEFLNEENQWPSPLSGDATLLYQLQNAWFSSVLLTADAAGSPKDGRLGTQRQPHGPTDHCFLFSSGAVKGSRAVRGGQKKQTSSPAPEDYCTTLSPSPTFQAPYLASQLLCPHTHSCGYWVLMSGS